jgi:hypothetical protein
MAITNPTAIRFSNEKIRVAADLLAQLDNFAASVLNEWNANGGTSLIPNDSQVIRDGASPSDDNGTGGDGRFVITGAKANNIINRLTEIRSTNASTGLAIGASGVRDTILQVATNTTRN